MTACLALCEHLRLSRQQRSYVEVVPQPSGNLRNMTTCLLSAKALCLADVDAGSPALHRSTGHCISKVACIVPAVDLCLCCKWRTLPGVSYRPPICFQASALSGLPKFTWQLCCCQLSAQQWLQTSTEPTGQGRAQP